MRHNCKQLELWMLDSSEPMPEELETHLKRCPACAERWQQERRYQHLLHQLRLEPIPTSQTRWEQVQRRLAERAVQRSGRLMWRSALAGALSMLFVVAVGVGGWWFWKPTPPNLEGNRQLAVGSGSEQEPPQEIASFHADSEVPPAPNSLLSDSPTPPKAESAPQRRIMIARTDAQASTMPFTGANAMNRTRKEVISERATTVRGGVLAMRNEEPDFSAPLEIEILPVEPIMPYGESQTAEYLPVNYAQLPQAESSNEGIVCSF